MLILILIFIFILLYTYCKEKFMSNNHPVAPTSLNVYKRVTIIRQEEDKVTFEDHSSGTIKSLSVKDFRGVLSAVVRAFFVSPFKDFCILFIL